MENFYRTVSLSPLILIVWIRIQIKSEFSNLMDFYPYSEFNLDPDPQN